ncbi:MAG: NAD(P)-dependent glycerol-3-phosphate dehydrogenase [Puniceicoccales bacterium]|jgi:glycerol-3-phosphate dehydrogenase (NAD(P)+)|nr:NAD(P)-dependent glycerol-3-phosphate dehydrogenase [Puniceicoccales bacterium]
MNFCIFGAGAWGTAMSIVLHRGGHSVTLVPRRLEHATALATTRINTTYLPDIPLHEDIQIAFEPRPPLMEADAVIFACPSPALRATAASLHSVLDTARRVRIFISLVKGLEQHTLLRPLQVIASELPNHTLGVLSGPTNAAEIARALPAAAIFASNGDETTTQLVQKALSTDSLLRVYRSTDTAGVELGGILKNIYAIGAGICDGLQLGSNAKASYLTRAIYEMTHLGVAAGGKAETFLGLSGVGDLIATAHGKWSRNRALGERLAQTDNTNTQGGEPIADDFAARHTAEGYRATACFMEFANKHQISAPILKEIHNILYGVLKPSETISNLMRRSLKQE